MYSNANEHDNVYLNKYFVSEPHSEKNIYKQIIDRDGNIFDFPGVEYTDVLKAELGREVIEPVVKYDAQFERLDDGKLIMVWTVRPDGRYWMDSWGFGAEDYESLSLYSYIDSDGNFLMPFKLYSIGYKFYGGYRLKRE